MYQKLFQITLVLFLVVVSIVMVGLVVTAILSAASSPMIARDQGIAIVVGGISERQLGFMIVAASLIIAGFYLFFRRRRFRR
jgi:hypothetical protein